MKTKPSETAIMIVTGVIIALFISCAATGPQQYLQSPQGHAVLTTSEDVANVALSAAATSFGGPVAGQLASAGLSALGAVLQGYINRPIPAKVVKATPGVAGVGSAVAPLVSSQKPVTQGDVNLMYQAAAVAATK
jgi:hypothetical protein